MAKHIIVARDPKSHALQPSPAAPMIHAYEELAIKEAERLAAVAPGVEFLVMELKSVSVSRSVSTTRI